MKRVNIKSILIILLLVAESYHIHAQKLVSKPFIGHSTKNELRVWCMFKNADSVYLKIDNQEAKTFFWHKEQCYKKYLPIICTFSNLNENTNYDISYSFDNRNYYPLITAKTGHDTISDFQFLAGSCAFIPAGINRIVKPFADINIFKQMQRDTAEMMLWLGDNLYYIFNYKTYKGQLKNNIKARNKRKLSSFLQSKQQYAIWDDHDYGSNNSDSLFVAKHSSLHVFQQFWPNPIQQTNNYYTFKKQDIQFFMLDDRYHKYGDDVVLGKSQLDWLKNELLLSNATFKFICIGMQALNPLSTKECLYKAKAEYTSLIEFIKQNKIKGIVFLSGDRHHAELMRIQEENLYPLYDFTTSPLTMYPIKISKRSREYKNPYTIANTHYASYNYGKISISGKNEDRICTIELKNKKGKTIWTYAIKAEELM